MTVPNFMSKALFFRIYAVERGGGEARSDKNTPGQIGFNRLHEKSF